MNRRTFLATAGLVTIGPGNLRSESDAQYTVEAKFYEKLAHKKIKCKLCPRECVIDERERGYCGVRDFCSWWRAHKAEYAAPGAATEKADDEFPF